MAFHSANVKPLEPAPQITSQPANFAKFVPMNGARRRLASVCDNVGVLSLVKCHGIETSFISQSFNDIASVAVNIAIHLHNAYSDALVPRLLSATVLAVTAWLSPFRQNHSMNLSPHLVALRVVRLVGPSRAASFSAPASLSAVTSDAVERLPRRQEAGS